MQAIEKAGSVFAFGEFTVRTAGTPERPLFCATDVCAVLGLRNARMACGRLEQDERELVSVQLTSGAKQVTYVTESGLYGLILGSRKPEAKAFRRWVTEEVLPAIRRTGSYGSHAAPALPTDPLALLRLSLDAIDAQRAQIAAVETRLEALESAPVVALGEGTGYTSITGWHVLRHRTRPSTSECAKLGAQATSECKRQGVAVGRTPDDRFGMVNTYPVDLLDELFGGKP